MLASHCLMPLVVHAFNNSPVSGETAKYYKHLSRMSRALAVAADFAMLSLGGELKRREMVSARLGDVLSHLYSGFSDPQALRR